jgi:phosphoribosylaminoimidazole (AIR) synthetase
MLRIQELSLSDNELATPDASLYQTFNGGNGALVITDEPDNVLAVLREHGKEGKVAGEIVVNSGIEIKSHGVTNPNQWIRFIPQAA